MLRCRYDWQGSLVQASVAAAAAVLGSTSTQRRQCWDRQSRADCCLHAAAAWALRLSDRVHDDLGDNAETERHDRRR